MRALPYRPDIDGLRAISVVAVILYHADVPGFSGGFIGVDVFFVISGYLITQLLMAPAERGVLAVLRDFYARRCRRILPALIVMLLVSACLAYWLFLPGHLANFGMQLGYTAGLLANVAVWRQGYFDAHTPFNPLLHLWSIAVEEQFYLLFPLVFLVSGRLIERRRRAVLVGAALASFALCLWAAHYKPAANFFLVPTRAWELLLGSIVALGVGRSLSAHPARDALAGAALLAILGCVVAYHDGLRYPGLYAVVPCAATAILVAAASSEPTRVGRWLSVKPLVFTGLISYSLYLWHLPVLAFAGYYHIRPLEPRHVAVLLPMIYLLSAASWRWVEAPVRTRRWLVSDTGVFRAAGGATLAIGLLGLLFWQSQGLPGRWGDAAATLPITDDRLQRDAIDCAERSLPAIAAGFLCRYGPRAGARADIVVWGDSHALALLPAYERIAAARNVRVHVAAYSACRPLLHAVDATVKSSRQEACRAFNDAAVSAIAAIDPAIVILNAYWTYPSLEIAAARGADLSHALPPFQAAFAQTLEAIAAEHRKVCVIGGVPTLEFAMPYAHALARRRGIDPAFFALTRSDALLQHGELDRHFAELRRRHAFTFVDPKDALCAGPTCATASAAGESLYRDDNHLSPAGALFVAPSLDACFDGIG